MTIKPVQTYCLPQGAHLPSREFPFKAPCIFLILPASPAAVLRDPWIQIASYLQVQPRSRLRILAISTKSRFLPSQAHATAAFMIAISGRKRARPARVDLPRRWTDQG